MSDNKSACEWFKNAFNILIRLCIFLYNPPVLKEGVRILTNKLIKNVKDFSMFQNKLLAKEKIYKQMFSMILLVSRIKHIWHVRCFSYVKLTNYLWFLSYFILIIGLFFSQKYNYLAQGRKKLVRKQNLVTALFFYW